MDAEQVEGASQVHPRFVTSLMAGAAAGLSVDLLFYPIDTIKTRLQSAQGFWKSGGFQGVYRGMGSVAVGSAPGASIFFVTYESSKAYLARLLHPGEPAAGLASSPYVHMGAATLGELVVKSRQQTSAYGRISSATAFRQVLANEGVRGLYRGYGSTIFREIPFTCIQFPLYERLKRGMAGTGREPSWWQAAAAGSLAGSLAAALTTPLDVVKTRIMLTEGQRSADAPRVKPRIWATMRGVYAEGGARALLAGVVPRTLWIGLGGAVFLGSFDAMTKVCDAAMGHA